MIVNKVVRRIIHISLASSIAITTVSCSSVAVKHPADNQLAASAWVDEDISGATNTRQGDSGQVYDQTVLEDITLGETNPDTTNSVDSRPNDPSATETYISLGTGDFVKAQSSRKRKRNGDITLNYQNADVREVIKGIVGDILQKNYFIDANVRGEVTLRTSKPITKADLIPTLEAILRMQKAILVRNNDLYQIVPESTDILGSAPSGLSLSTDEGYQILIAPLKYIAAGEMHKLLEPIKSRSSKIDVDEARNLLVLAGSQAELKNMQQTIDTFDVNQLKGMSVGVFHLKTVDAKTIINDLENIFGDTSDGPIAGLLKFVPIERLNALLVLTPQSTYLKEVSEWVNRLDVASQGSGAGLHVYKVQNGKASVLAGLLTSLFAQDGNRKPAKAASLNSPGISGPQPAKSTKNKDTNVTIGDISIVADEENNLLIIRATPSDYSRIDQALVKLDVLPRQVLVEVSIVEVSLDESLEYGIQWYLQNGRSNANFTGSVPSGGFSYSVLDKAGAIKGLLGTLASESKANVISSPSLMVLDNRTATIRVGDQVPIRTSETTNTSSGSSALVTSTIQYRDTGIILKVKPRVNSGGMVIMEVSQEVSDVSQVAAGGVPSPTIETRSIDTHIAVQTGETIVLGGLIKERKDNTNSGIPILRSIPLLGRLFQGSSDTTKRTELVVMITPSTVSNSSEAREVTREYQAGMKRLMTAF